jgi:hypothetical protein
VKQCIGIFVSVGVATSTFGGKKLSPDSSTAYSVKLSSGTFKFRGILAQTNSYFNGRFIVGNYS